MRCSTLCAALLAALLYPVVSRAWSFSLTEQPQTCIGINLAWSGGTAPYSFMFAHMPDVAPDQVSNISSWSSGVVISDNFDKADSSGNAGVGSNYFGFTPFVIIGSDSTGFGTGGTSEVFVVQPEQAPLLPGCDTSPGPNNTDYLSYLAGFSTNITECGQGYIQLKNTAIPAFWIDTIVPLGQSYQTGFNTSSSSNGTYSWPIRLTAGTIVSFIFDDGNGHHFVTPLMTVQPGTDASCNPQSTISASPTTLPTAGVPRKSSGATGTTSRGWSTAGGAGLVTLLVVCILNL